MKTFPVVPLIRTVKRNARLYWSVANLQVAAPSDTDTRRKVRSIVLTWDKCLGTLAALLSQISNKLHDARPEIVVCDRCGGLELERFAWIDEHRDHALCEDCACR